MYDNVAELLKKNGLRIADVARATGVPYSTFTDWKAGRYVPKYDKLQKIADFFGVSVDYLLSENPDTADAPVQKNEQAGYYTNPETAKKAQELYDDPKYRVLFDAAEGSDPDDLQMAADLLLRLKQTRRD